MNMKIIAHRGSSFAAPENTLAAMRLAVEEKADGVEFDIHLTRDGKVVVIHDDNTYKTTGLKAAVRDMSLEELKLLDAGCWKGREWRCEAVPEMSEVLGILPDNMLAFVEIKCGPEVLPAVAQGVQPFMARVLFVGFSLETMALTKQHFPSCKVLWNLTMAKDGGGRWRPDVWEIVSSAKSSGIDGLGIGFCEAIDAELVRQVREAGMELFVWTVDEVDQAKALRSLGVDYLATNRPGWIRENLKT